MQRRLLLVTFVALALFAAYFATRDAGRSDGAADFPPAAVEVPRAEPVELAAPPVVEPAESRATALEPRPAEVATPSSAAPWTGVRVRVLAVETRAPLANVRVSARLQGARQSWKIVDASRGTLGESPRTDERGIAELVLDAGFTGTIHANGVDRAAGWGEHAVESPLAAGEVRELEILLPTQPDVVLHGRVVDRETSTPIPDARVGPSLGLGKIREDLAQRTDADGRFRVEGATWNPQIFQVIATGYEIAALRAGPGHADPATPLEIALSRAATARITATGADGSPLAGKRVALTTAGYRFGRPNGMDLIGSAWVDEARYIATTDASGRAFFAELPPRMPLAGVLSEGREELFRAPEEISLEPGELREIAWRVGTGCTIHGVALEESGAVAAGLDVALQAARFPQPTHFRPFEREGRRSAKTDAEGRFTFEDVGPGDWWVGPAPAARSGRQPAAEDAPAPVAQLVQVAPGAVRVDVTIRVARGHSIRGRLLDPDGKPVNHAFVTIERAADRLVAHENVNATDGTFALGPLEPGEYVLNGQSIGEFVDALPVIARTGDTDVVIQFRRGGGIAGVVLGVDGKPAQRADVFLNGRVAGRWSNLSSAAGADGGFQFDGLEAGLYDLAARTADGRIGVATAIEVRAGAKAGDLRIETKPGARVRVRYDGPKPHIGISVLQDGVTVHADGVEKGTESTFAVPGGPCVVRAILYPEQIQTDLAVDLAVGETRDLVFDGAWR